MKKYKFWNSSIIYKNLKYVPINNLKNFTGYVNYKDHDNNLILQSNRSKQSIIFNIRDIAPYDFIFYDKILKQFFIKKKINYLESSHNNLNINAINDKDLLSYKKIEDLKLKQKIYFKLINRQKVLANFIIKRRERSKSNLIKKFKIFKISQELMDDFWFKFKRRVIWHLLEHIQQNKSTVKGIVLASAKFKGLYISLGNFYLVFMPMSHIFAKPKVPLAFYYLFFNSIIGNIIYFKILTLNEFSSKLPAVSSKKIYLKKKKAIAAAN
jgi:hypothetical protein